MNCEKQARHLLRLRALGLSDKVLMAAIEQTNRDNFVPSRWQHCSYATRSLPLPCGQDMTCAQDVARMVDSLNLNPSCRVLELGTGSGYQTNILARLSRHVVTVERFATLLDNAKEQNDYLGHSNIEYILADGQLGYPKLGPYDRIIANFSYDEPPRIFLEQMTMGSHLVLPISNSKNKQILTVFTKIGSRFEAKPLFEVHFAPPLQGVAQAI